MGHPDLLSICTRAKTKTNQPQLTKMHSCIYNTLLRTRRRRIEGASGRVGTCSGETEVAFQACLETHCIGELGDDDDDNGDIALDMIISLLVASSCVLVMLVTERYVDDKV